MSSHRLIAVALLSSSLGACTEVTSDPGVTRDGSEAVDAEIKRMKAEAEPPALTPVPTYTPPYQTKEWEAVKARDRDDPERGSDLKALSEYHERQKHEREQDARIEALETR